MSAPRASAMILQSCDEAGLTDPTLLRLLLDYVDEFCIPEHVNEYILNQAEPEPITDAEIATMRTIMQVMES